MTFSDIHTHILYGVDDGAKDLKDSMELITEEWEQGVNRIIMTPHYGPKFGCPDRKLLENRFAKIQEEASKYYPDMELYLGSELYYQSNTIQDLKDGKALTLAGSKYVLVEFGVNDSYSKILQAIQDFIYAGYLPIIAHVERYEALRQHLDRAKELVKTGAYLQVNAASFLGGFLNKTTAFCNKLLKEDLVYFIASDCHDLKNRCPNIAEGLELVHKKVKNYEYESFVDKVIERKYI